MSKYPTELYPTLLDIPVATLSNDANQSFSTLAEKGYIIKEGLTKEIIEQLQNIITEDSIREYCPKDQSERFTNVQIAENWMQKGRAFYVLLHAENNSSIITIAGYGWIGEKQTSLVPGGETTFSLRISEQHQGNGLAGPFSACMLSAAQEKYGAKKLWLETWASNRGAVHIYHKLGFHNVAEKEDQRPSLVAPQINDTRIYMDIEDV